MGMPHANHSSAGNQQHPRVYVASLSDYNNGRLHGAWVEACQEPEPIVRAIRRMLSQSSEPCAEEWAIHDYEGFCGVRLAENARVATLSQLAQGICSHGEAYAAWITAVVGEGPGDIGEFRKSYVGHFQSIVGYSRQRTTHFCTGPDPDLPRQGTCAGLDLGVQAGLQGTPLKVVHAADGGAHVFR